jgi:predicted ribosome quality control (RQC) complex YloA/Tae2 family protein
MIAGDLRAAWWTDTPALKDWLVILQRHSDSPFARELRDRRLAGASALANAEGKLDGLRLELEGGGHLSLRFFPRPGALWHETTTGEIRAQQGHMGGPLLSAVTSGPSEFDPAEHTRRCEAALRELVNDRLGRWLDSELRREQKKQTRRLLAQEADLARAELRLDLRGKADLLAAHLHEIPAGQNAVVLEDFDGNSQTIELDPRLNASGNLEALYRQAAKAERTVTTLRERLATLRAEDEHGHTPVERLSDAHTLEQRIELARALELPLAPSGKDARRGGTRISERLPYLSYRLTTGEELRVGRSAKDNDELLRRHSSGKDLWLHAQGVEGSHVILRVAERDPAAAIIEAAARLAAKFSKARNSKLVPVLVTQRRYVRKPRKAAVGAVVAERGRTLFVEPGIPEGCEREATL